MPKLVFKLSDKQSLDFPLSGNHVRLGRNAANEIVIDNSWISSFHAEFRLGEDGVMEVRDLGSRNGTTVNGKPIESSRLKPGDIVSFGQLEAVFDPPAVAAPVTAAPPLNGVTVPRPAVPIPKPTVRKPVTPVERPTVPAPVVAAVPDAPMKPPLMKKRSDSGNLPTQPVHPVPRTDLEETVPVPQVVNRPVVPAPLKPTTPVALQEAPGLAESRAEFQQILAQITEAKNESKSLTESLEKLRADRQKEEQALAEVKSKGEQEALELRARLEKLQEEIKSAESSAAEAAMARTSSLMQQETEITARLESLKSSEQAAISAAKAAEEKLSALRDGKEGLTEISARLKTAAGELEEAIRQKTAAIAGIAEAETETAAAREEFADVQARLLAAAKELPEAESKAATARDELAGIQEKVKAAAAELEEAVRQKTAALAAVTEAESKVTAAGEELVRVQKEVQTATAALTARESELFDVNHRLEDLHRKMESASASLAEKQMMAASAGKEASSLTKKMEEVRRELAGRESALTEVKAAVLRLEERRQTFADAPDPVWGTVHLMAKGIIKHIDLLDDLMTHLSARSGFREVVDQLKTFKTGLMEILTEYTVEPYQYEPGFSVDVSARKKIQIVESEEDHGAGTRIQKTWRPGYVCANGAIGVQTLLRKAEVSVLIGR
ncbi:MAG TPA: FHA domain-containing protein [Verrucomicrobiales bacterium]|nr:FHA domain-containing protein [Verrucomicrobiales bacterium]